MRRRTGTSTRWRSAWSISTRSSSSGASITSKPWNGSSATSRAPAEPAGFPIWPRRSSSSSSRSFGRCAHQCEGDKLPTAWGELDHIMIFCNVGAPEAGALTDRGLHEGPGNTHPGQGTANRRFFFPNAYLELVWIENSVEAQSPEARDTRLFERWQRRGNGACPFGLVFRPGPRGPVVPPASWTYAPRYFPPGFTIEVARDLPANEPLLFYLSSEKPSLLEILGPAEGAVPIG